MLDVALRALPASRRPVDLFAVKAVGEPQLLSPTVAPRVRDYFSGAQFMALPITMVIEVLQPTPDFALDALGLPGRIGFLCSPQPAEGLLLTLGQLHGSQQVLEHLCGDPPVFEDDF